MDRRLFLAGCVAATPAVGLAPAGQAAPRTGVVPLLRARVVNPDLFGPAPRPSAGARLALRRDRERSFDPAAIAVVGEGGAGLGYLPPASARPLAALMDAGLRLWAEAEPGSLLTVSVCCAAVDLAPSDPDGPASLS